MIISKTLLFIFVVVFGIEIGAGLYETLVVLPLWTLSPPDSVIEYYKHNAAEPQFALNAGGRFWMFFTPLTGLTALLALLSGFRTNPQHRRWRIIGSVLALIVVAATFAWFVPNIMRLYSEAVLTMSADEVTTLTNQWVRLNWVRVAVYLAGWFCALRAFSIPPQIHRARIEGV
jgi:hypothetical protein